MALFSATISAQAECERETIAALPSPDGKWIALVREGWCSDGGFVTVSTDSVRLVPHAAAETVTPALSADEPTHEGDVLVVGDYGRPENRPAPKWLSLRELQITIPNISDVGLRKDGYRDVHISVRHEPDDPAARAAWEKQRLR